MIQDLNSYHTNPQALGKVQTYALMDKRDQKYTPVRINRETEGSSYNQTGHGIFHTVNSFVGKRQAKNCVRVNAWFIEVDGEDKKATLARLHSGLVPTMIVESKNGFHCYWACIDPSLDYAVKTWNAIVKKRLIPFYKADPKASDISRILRSPNFFHMKDPENPYLVRKLLDQRVGYTCDEMLKFYPDVKSASEAKRRFKDGTKAKPMSGSFWDNVWNLNCEYALEKLSGSDHVSGEVYTFRENASGTKNIFVNGTSTSCWIDRNGRIGSFENGGPSIAQWLNWFHKDYAKVVSIIEKEFPECLSKAEQLVLI